MPAATKSPSICCRPRLGSLRPTSAYSDPAMAAHTAQGELLSRRQAGQLRPRKWPDALRRAGRLPPLAKGQNRMSKSKKSTGGPSPLGTSCPSPQRHRGYPPAASHSLPAAWLPAACLPVQPGQLLTITPESPCLQTSMLWKSGCAGPAAGTWRCAGAGLLALRMVSPWSRPSTCGQQLHAFESHGLSSLGAQQPRHQH